MAGRSGWFYARVSLLGSILVVVVAWAAHDALRRRARTAWDETLSVAVVLVRSAPVDPEAVVSFGESARSVELELERALRSYRPEALPPFAFHVLGPVPSPGPPPALQGEDPWALVRFGMDLFRYRRALGEKAGLSLGAFDSTIAVVVRPPESEERRFVEGLSQQGGSLGIVQVELATDTVAMSWFVALHELFHTLGADDRYDVTGRTRIPEGLPEPAREPLFPQPRADVMARGRALSLHLEVLPDSVEEFGVGPVTAREIGWLHAASTTPSP